MLPHETEGRRSSTLADGVRMQWSSPDVMSLLERRLYILLIALAIALSSFGTLTAMRTQLMLCAQPETRTHKLLAAMTERRGVLVVD